MNIKDLIKQTDPMYKHNPLYKQLNKKEVNVNIKRQLTKNGNIFYIEKNEIIFKLIEKDGYILLEDVKGLSLQKMQKIAKYIYYFNNKSKNKLFNNKNHFLNYILDNLSRQYNFKGKKRKKLEEMNKIITNDDIEKFKKEENIFVSVKDRVFLVTFKNKETLNSVHPKQLEQSLNYLIPLINFPLKKGEKINTKIYKEELRNFIDKYPDIKALDYLKINKKNEIVLINLYHSYEGANAAPAGVMLKSYRHIILHPPKEQEKEFNFFKLYKAYTLDIKDSLEPKPKPQTPDYNPEIYM